MERISSRSTFLVKYILPVGVFILTSSFAFEHDELSFASVIPSLIIGFGFLALWWLYAAKSKLVYIGQDCLIVGKPNEGRKITFSEIDYIQQHKDISTLNISIILKSKEEIMFIPPLSDGGLFSDSRIVAHLKERTKKSNQAGDDNSE